MSINDRLKKTIEDLKSKLEYSTNEYNKAVANYGEQNIQAIYSRGEKTALEYAINQLEEITDTKNEICKLDEENDSRISQAIRNKLGQLEDLEEKLGCPLEIVFKALINGVYYEDVANHMIYMPVDLHLNLEGEYVLYFSDEEYLLTKNYKKTWWLKEKREE